MVKPKTAVEATRTMRARSEAGTADWHRRCLNGVRTALGLPWVAADAAGAYRGTKRRHAQGVPPKGVPVFWADRVPDGPGHVALSDGGGWCWSNDVKRRGCYDRVRIDSITEQWRLPYLGWTEDLGGHALYHPQKPRTAPQEAPKPPTPGHPDSPGEWRLGPLDAHWRHYPGRDAFVLGEAHPAVAVLDAWLVAMGFDKFHDGNGYQPSATFTAFTRANVKAFQRSKGWYGVGADGYPGPETWDKLRFAATQRLLAAKAYT